MGRKRLTFAALVALCLVGCGGDQRFRSLAPGETSTETAAAFTRGVARAHGTLVYRVHLGAQSAMSVELASDFELVVRDRHSGRERQRIVLGSADYDITALSVSRDESRVYVASKAGWVREYRLDGSTSPENYSEWRLGSAVHALALSDDESLLALGTATGVLCVRRLSDGAQLQCALAGKGVIGALDFAGDSLASGSWQGDLVIWSVPSLARRGHLPGKSIAALAFDDTGERLAVARNQRAPLRSQALDRDEHAKGGKIDDSGENWIALHPANLSSTVRLEGHRHLISGLAWSGDALLSSSWDRTIRLWDAKSGTERYHRTWPEMVRQLALFDGRDLAVALWARKLDAASLMIAELLYPPRR